MKGGDTMKNFLDDLSRITSIRLARTTTRRKALSKIVGSVVGGVVGLTFFADKAFAAACDKCQSWYVGSWCGCSPPNGKYCSGCGSSASCPSGYRLSKAWGYASTGCWCSSCSGSSNYYVCCDCTKGANTSTKYSTDCGCKSSVSQSGYCVQ
jgi:hypothetical protein